MLDIKQLQKQIYENKVRKGFNTTNVHQEFCYLIEETGEACRAYNRKLPDLGEELADIAIYVMGLAEILNVDLEEEILKKVTKNENREYRNINGIPTRIKDQ
jgi:NTP pyrophosphatase (non-canonical NTP hydrolase)